jgi:uncharacterized protein
MTASNKDVLLRANASMARGDYEGFLSHCTDDTTWTFVGDRTLKGKGAVRAYIQATYKEPPRFDVQRMIAEGDTVAALGHITLKDDDGNDVRSAYCDVWRFREGRMASLQAFVIEE